MPTHDHNPNRQSIDPAERDRVSYFTDQTGGHYDHLRERASALYRDFLSHAGCGGCGESDPRHLTVIDEPAPECPDYDHDLPTIVVRCDECAPAFPDDYVVLRLERLAATASSWAAVYECEAVRPLGVDVGDEALTHSCGADIVAVAQFD